MGRHNLAGACVFATMLILACVAAPVDAASPAEDLAEALSMDVGACDRPERAVPAENLRSFPEDRIRQTLHGIWKGRVWGNYPEEVLDDDNLVNVDYYMIVDTVNHEALVIEQLSDERSAPAPTAELLAAGPIPTWSYLMCGREQYVPVHPQQVHEFQKVSNDVNDARAIVEKSTGLKISDAELAENGFVITDVWERLVRDRYFDELRYPAYAGALFKPFEFGNTVGAEGNTLFELRMTAEYRGGGATAADFESGVPIRGYEAASFVGVASPEGDYILASTKDGEVSTKEASSGGIIDVFFEKVIIGPLPAEPSGTREEAAGSR